MVSGYAGTFYRSGRKPFNPMLGETFEDERMKFVAEKVSHHPPVVACHAEGDGWEFWCTSGAKQKISGKSFEIVPTGKAHVKIGDHHYEWKRPSSYMRNLISGDKYLEHVGKITIESNDKLSCELNFKEAKGSWKNVVVGNVLNRSDKVKAQLTGKWHEGFSLILDSTGTSRRTLWRANAFPPHARQYYGFTSFATTLNEITPDIEPLLPPTDSRFRPDQRALEEGRVTEADKEKLRVEEAQRRRRAERESKRQEWKPKWFVYDAKSQEWMYKGGYWEARARRWEGVNFESLW
jgi:hypothetical protein